MGHEVHMWYKNNSSSDWSNRCEHMDLVLNSESAMYEIKHAINAEHM